jgi:hypothetical protein
MASAPRRPAVRRSLLITAALVILAIVAVLAIALH